MVSYRLGSTGGEASKHQRQVVGWRGERHGPNCLIGAATQRSPVSTLSASTSHCQRVTGGGMHVSILDLSAYKMPCQQSQSVSVLHQSLFQQTTVTRDGV